MFWPSVTSVRAPMERVWEMDIHEHVAVHVHDYVIAKFIILYAKSKNSNCSTLYLIKKL